MMSQIGYLKLLITRSILSGPLDFEIKRVACSLNLNTWPFWFEISYEFLLNMNSFNIVENLSSDKLVWTE